MQEDSVLLWKEVCSNKLLAKVDLVLFLNKCDILESKLKSGVRLSKYVRSFGERANDPEVAQKCESSICVIIERQLTATPDFRSKFSAIHREHSPIPRKFYGFCTSVTVCYHSLTFDGFISDTYAHVLAGYYYNGWHHRGRYNITRYLDLLSCLRTGFPLQ